MSEDKNKGNDKITRGQQNRHKKNKEGITIFSIDPSGTRIGGAGAIKTDITNDINTSSISTSTQNTATLPMSSKYLFRDSRYNHLIQTSVNIPQINQTTASIPHINQTTTDNKTKISEEAERAKKLFEEAKAKITKEAERNIIYNPLDPAVFYKDMETKAKIIKEAKAKIVYTTPRFAASHNANANADIPPKSSTSGNVRANAAKERLIVLRGIGG